MTLLYFREMPCHTPAILEVANEMHRDYDVQVANGLKLTLTTVQGRGAGYTVYMVEGDKVFCCGCNV